MADMRGAFQNKNRKKRQRSILERLCAAERSVAFALSSGGAPGFHLRAALKMKKLFGFFCDILNDRTGEQNRDDCACAKLPAEQNANDDKKNV